MPVGNSAELTDERLVALLDEAKRAWIESTLVNVTAEELANIEIRVENFGSGALATYSDGVITIDDDAAGVGWFIDLTPAESSEFAASRSEEHTSELQSLMRISYAVFCFKKKKEKQKQ